MADAPIPHTIFTLCYGPNLQEIERAVCDTTATGMVKPPHSFSSLLNNVPYYKSPDRVIVPVTRPGNNHQISSLLRPYLIDPIVTLSLVDVDSTSVVSNVDHNSHGSLRRVYSSSFFGIEPSLNFAIARVSLNNISICNTIRLTSKQIYLLLVFLYYLVIL